ncbi:MAG: four helix bundle protein [Bacteroidaceae bacterium]|nr:four helix bundle protein [Bacteroidaceae bacterium]
MTQSFQDIIAWQKAHEFVLLVYKTTRNFPAFERYALASQFQRAAVSIAANIAEGYKRISNADKLRMYNISQGSLEECRYYIILANDLGYIDEDITQNLNYALYDASRFLNAYCKSIKEKDFSHQI